MASIVCLSMKLGQMWIQMSEDVGMGTSSNTCCYRYLKIQHRPSGTLSTMCKFDQYSFLSLMRTVATMVRWAGGTDYTDCHIELPSLLRPLYFFVL